VRNLWLAILVAAGCVLVAGAQNKDTFTPMALDSGFGAMDITAPAIPPEQIIHQFAAKESEFQQALNHYTYRRTAKVQTIDDDNKVDGEYYEVDDVIFDPGGARTEKWSLRRRTRWSGSRCRPRIFRTFSVVIRLYLPRRYRAIRREIRGSAKGRRDRLLCLRREPQGD